MKPQHWVTGSAWKEKKHGKWYRKSTRPTLLGSREYLLYNWHRRYRTIHRYWYVTTEHIATVVLHFVRHIQFPWMLFSINIKIRIPTVNAKLRKWDDERMRSRNLSKSLQKKSPPWMLFVVTFQFFSHRFYCSIRITWNKRDPLFETFETLTNMFIYWPDIFIFIDYFSLEPIFNFFPRFENCRIRFSFNSYWQDFKLNTHHKFTEMSVRVVIYGGTVAKKREYHAMYVILFWAIAAVNEKKKYVGG